MLISCEMVAEGISARIYGTYWDRLARIGRVQRTGNYKEMGKMRLGKEEKEGKSRRANGFDK